jgi:hypothetical protein
MYEFDFQNFALISAALCTIGIYSFLFGENKFYRIFESIFLGTGGAILLVLAWEETLYPKWWKPMLEGFAKFGQSPPAGSEGVSYAWNALSGIVVLILGLSWYTIYTRKYEWLSRVTMGIVIGAAAGLAFKDQFGRQMPQIADSAKPLFVLNSAGKFHPTETLNNLIFLVALVTVMSYFFFSFEQRSRVMQGSAKIGRWMLMITFGAYFGNTVMARMSLFIQRYDFMTRELPRVWGGWQGINQLFGG